MSDGYLSKDRKHLAGLQRARRARMVRIDYMPAAGVLAIIEATRAKQRPGSLAATNSAVLDAIVAEWATLTGIKYGEIEKPMTTAMSAGIKRPVRTDAYDFGERQPEFPPPSPARAGVNDYGAELPSWAAGWLAAGKAKQASRRVVCGARRHRDGQPCQAKSEPGKRRCKWHGGRSTGPRTAAGKAAALANLRQNRPGLQPC